MDNLVAQLINNISRNAPISNDRFEHEKNRFDFELPYSYLEFMKITNGGINNSFKKVFFELWPIEKLLKLNKDYEVNEFANGYFIVGTDKGGTAYAINKKTKEFVAFEFIGMLIEDEPILLGRDFNEFVKSLLGELSS
jgi:hypothetical protein